MAEQLGPGGRWRRWFLAALGVVGALPSLVWAFGGSALMFDDWWLADAFSRGDLSHRWDQFFESATATPARPGAAVYYAVSYGAFGRNAVLHAILLAVINAALCILVFIVAEKLWKTNLAVWIAITYAVLPNRGSTRMWFAVATYPLALVLVLLGVLVLLRGRPVWAGVLMAVGVVTYEGVTGLALLALVAWVLVSFRERWRTGLLALLPVVVGGGALFLLSPKQDGSTNHFGGLDRLLASQFGVGDFEWPVLGALAFATIGVGVVVVIFAKGRWQAPYRSVVLWGIAILLAGWLPFFVTDWPIATDGFFDRANGVVGLGTAVLVGALLALANELLPARVGLIGASALVVLLFVLNAKDVRAFRDSVARGKVLFEQVLVDLPPTDRQIRIDPAPSPTAGVAQYPYGSNLAVAARLQRGDELRIWMSGATEETPQPPDDLCYDPTTRVLDPCSPP